MFEFAERNAERIVNYEFQDSSDDGNDLRRSIVRPIYYNAEVEIEAVLSQNEFTQYRDEVEQVCVEELSERFDKLISRFSGTGKPGPVEIAIEGSARPLKVWLADALLQTLTGLEEKAEDQRRADERRRPKSSRSWVSVVRDFLSW